MDFTAITTTTTPSSQTAARIGVSLLKASRDLDYFCEKAEGIRSPNIISSIGKKIVNHLWESMPRIWHSIQVGHFTIAWGEARKAFVLMDKCGQDANGLRSHMERAIASLDTLRHSENRYYETATEIGILAIYASLTRADLVIQRLWGENGGLNPKSSSQKLVATAAGEAVSNLEKVYALLPENEWEEALEELAKVQSFARTFGAPLEACLKDADHAASCIAAFVSTPPQARASHLESSAETV